jgi:hypothetical protein
MWDLDNISLSGKLPFPSAGVNVPITMVAFRSADVATRAARPLAVKAAAASGAWRSLVSISR